MSLREDFWKQNADPGRFNFYNDRLRHTGWFARFSNSFLRWIEEITTFLQDEGVTESALDRTVARLLGFSGSRSMDLRRLTEEPLDLDPSSEEDLLESLRGLRGVLDLSLRRQIVEHRLEHRKAFILKWFRLLYPPAVLLCWWFLEYLPKWLKWGLNWTLYTVIVGYVAPWFFLPAVVDTLKIMACLYGFWMFYQYIPPIIEAGSNWLLSRYDKKQATDSQFDRNFGPSTKLTSVLDRLAPTRKIFASSTGHFGWVPDTAVPGDSVCVFQGNVLPFVLRRVPSGWRLLGDAWVLDKMTPEAWFTAPGEIMTYDVT